MYGRQNIQPDSHSGVRCVQKRYAMLIEQAVMQLLEDKKSLAMIKLITANGAAINKQTRKRSPGNGTSQESVANEEEGVTSYVSALGDFEQA